MMLLQIKDASKSLDSSGSVVLIQTEDVADCQHNAVSRNWRCVDGRAMVISSSQRMRKVRIERGFA